jgi:glycosyltransferase involved in cell wall biosynthesis
LIVADNASDDDTPDVVASFADDRIVYHRLEQNVGRVANTNGLVARTSTEFLVLLGDDDELRPSHLEETVSALRRWPSAGLAHTGCVVIDQSGHVLNPHVRFLKTKARVHFEPARIARERCMKTGWGACFCSIMFRTDAITQAGGLREADGVIDDLPLLLRIAEDWDFVYVNEPLANVRAHVGASSSVLGEFGPSGFRSAPDLAEMIHSRKLAFLAEAALPDSEQRRLHNLADTSRRRERLAHFSMEADAGATARQSLRSLVAAVRRDPRMALDPIAWRFVVGQLGARRVRAFLRSASRRSRDDR